jgi:hypothetical protein
MSDELEKRALVAWKKHCTRNGFIYQIPSLVETVGKRVILSNINGVLYEYKVK